MAIAYISVGSNIDPEAHYRKALLLLQSYVRIERLSTVYRTLPEGDPSSPPFYNGVVEVETALPPTLLKTVVLRYIEEQLGRTRSADKNAPRTIDLDLLDYDGQTIHQEEVHLPDPNIPRHAFIAVPLAELAPNLRLPGSPLPLRDIADQYSNAPLERLEAYTAQLRKDLLHGLPES
jgi:2-amino-4-hydroxy-6-hydroxymethyldihydropteridine diphosphokinase